MIVENPYLTDDEVLSLYGVADLAWSFYPQRDQASGIFGRAVQAGVVPLVRSGSFLESYAGWYSLPCVVMDESGTIVEQGDLRLGERSDGLKPSHRDTLKDMRDLSLQRIRSALYA